MHGPAFSFFNKIALYYETIIKDEPTKGDPRSGWPLAAVFHTFCERSLGEKAAGNTFEWESTVRSGSQVDSS
eukprot:SAG31_NODE_1396_length_8511_cov_1.939491_11_plen_71_part_01